MSISALMPIICIAPSPTNAITGRSGNANFAPSAYGTAQPIVASVPLIAAFIPARSFRWRAHQLAAVPESAVVMQPSGRSGESSWNTRCGLIGSPGSIARSSSTRQPRSTQPSTSSRHDRSAFRSSSGSSARSVWVASPTRFTSIG
jgi:hypothetical protein